MNTPKFTPEDAKFLASIGTSVHKLGTFEGTPVVSKTCPTCGEEVVVLIHDLKTGRRFCHLCGGNEELRLAK
jgi:hypothetical protein